MCTLLCETELVRNVERVGWARYRIWSGELGQATEFRDWYKIGPQEVDEYLGPEMGDH